MENFKLSAALEVLFLIILNNYLNLNAFDHILPFPHVPTDTLPSLSTQL